MQGYDYTADENYTGAVEVAVNGGPWTQPAITPELEPTDEPEPATAAEVRAWAMKNYADADKPGKRGRIAAKYKTAFTAATGRPVK